MDAQAWHFGHLDIGHLDKCTGYRLCHCFEFAPTGYDHEWADVSEAMHVICG